jgi:hypothetical protein
MIRERPGCSDMVAWGEQPKRRRHIYYFIRLSSIFHQMLRLLVILAGDNFVGIEPFRDH